MSLAAALVVSLSGEAVALHGDVVDKLPFGTTELISASPSGEAGDGQSGFGCENWGYSASDNGRFVAFQSRAGNLHPGDVNRTLIQDIFVRDRKTGALDLVSALDTGLTLPLPDTGVPQCQVRSYGPAISGSGRFVAFVSNLPLTGDLETTKGTDNVFVRDLRKGTTELVSRTWDGNPPAGRNPSGFDGISISDDGRFIAFTSDAGNILEDACPSSDPILGVVPTGSLLSLPCQQIYVRDRVKDVTQLVSKSSAGEPAMSPITKRRVSWDPSISGNGRFVAFTSLATNFDSLDRNGPLSSDVFVHDLRRGKTERVSLSRDGMSGNRDSALDTAWARNSQAISDDGRFVVFGSGATDLVPGNLPSLTPYGAFVRDRKTDSTERASVSSSGVILEAPENFTISDDGRYVLADIVSCLNSCAADPSHRYRGGLRHDRKTGQVDLVTWTPLGAAPPRDPKEAWLDFSFIIGGNGRFVVANPASDRDVLPSDTNKTNDVYVRDFWAKGLEAGHLNAPSIGPARSQPTKTSVTLRDASDDALVAGIGAEILQARVAYRAALSDLFVRIDFDRMFAVPPSLGLAPYPVIYGVRIVTQEATYELRIQGHGGDPASGGGIFGLFRCDDGGCSEISKLAGGFGTVGEAVVSSIPTDQLGLEYGGRILSLETFAGPGTYESGVIERVDSVRL